MMGKVTNIVVNIEDDILKQLLVKISNLQDQIIGLSEDVLQLQEIASYLLDVSN